MPFRSHPGSEPVQSLQKRQVRRCAPTARRHGVPRSAPNLERSRCIVAGIGWSSGPASAFSQAMSTVRGAKGRVSGDRGANSSNRRTFAPETTADLFKWLNQTDNIPCIVSQTGRTSGQLLNGRTTMAELVPLPKIRANGVDRPVRMRYLCDGPTISGAVSRADGDFSARRECAS